jgi:prolyl-tRNA synthetase
VPHRVTIGDRGLKEGQVEYQHRRDTEPTKVALGEVFVLLKQKTLRLIR